MLNKITINGKKGITVCYQINNFRYDSATSTIAWDLFRFYSPRATETDDEGFNYLTIEAVEIDVTPETNLNKSILIKISMTDTDAVQVYITYEGEAEPDVKATGSDADIVITGTIPSLNSGESLEIDYKEVTSV
jgi:hypothetical protein